MGVGHHQAQSKSDRLIQAMERLSENIERLLQDRSDPLPSGMSFADAISQMSAVETPFTKAVREGNGGQKSDG